MVRIGRRVLVGVALLVMVATLAVPRLWHAFQSMLQPVLVPLVRWGDNLGETLRTVSKAEVLKQENDELRDELAAARAREAELGELAYENERLRQLVAVPLPAGTHALGIEVIGEQADETGQRYLVNRGSRDGLVVGLPVVAGYTVGEGGRPRAVLVGIITSVSDQVSGLTLVTSSDSRVLAEVVNASRSQGLVTGQFNLAMQLGFVPADDEVAAGNEVVTSSHSSLIPAGILLGQVTSVTKSPTDFFLTATVVPVVPLNRFRFLTVLLPTTH